MTDGNQAEYAQRIDKVLNLGVLLDAVAVGLEVSAANAALAKARRRDPPT